MGAQYLSFSPGKWENEPVHGCCWDILHFACCGLVVEIPTQLLKIIFWLPFQREPTVHESLQ